VNFVKFSRFEFLTRAIITVAEKSSDTNEKISSKSVIGIPQKSRSPTYTPFWNPFIKPSNKHKKDNKENTAENEANKSINLLKNFITHLL
jgi:hypothetical protein